MELNHSQQRIELQKSFAESEGRGRMALDNLQQKVAKIINHGGRFSREEIKL